MAKIVILPHPQLCPKGAIIQADAGKSICDNLLANGIEIEHACEKSCACTTCHIVVREGSNALPAAEENEDDFLDRAWGLEPTSRLSCQVKPPDSVHLVVEIPRYSINHAKEDA